jgi:hypothetical protein
MSSWRKKYVSPCPEEPAEKLNKSVGPFLQVLQTLPFPYKKRGFMEAAWEAALCLYICVCIRTVASGRVEFRCLGWDIRV